MKIASMIKLRCKKDFIHDIKEHATNEECKEIINFLLKYKSMQEAIMKSPSVSGILLSFGVSKLSIEQIDMYYKFIPPLYNMACNTYKKRCIEQLQAFICENMIEKCNFMVICDIFTKHPVIDEIFGIPQFRDFHFEWMDINKLKISL